ncbi:MAG: DedA family protein [Planctomycetota bacterium]|nr:DedA family protein [Planctomycetota bacterium]
MEDLFFQYIAQWSYIGLFVVLLAAGMGLPLPEDIPLLAGGWLVSEGHANLHMMMATGLVGVLIGDFIMFSLGRRWGDQIVEHRWFRRILKPWLLEKARNKFEQHGAKIIFAARFMPGLRAVMFVTAGIFRVPYWKFMTFDGTAALISVPVWVWAGSYFPAQIKEIMGGTRIATHVLVGAIVFAFVAFVSWEYIRNYRRQRQHNTVVKSAPLVPPDPERPKFEAVPDKPAVKRKVSGAARVTDRLSGG